MNVFLIPLFNEAANVQALATSLMQADNDPGTLFLFIDDGSADGTAEAIRKAFSGRTCEVLVNPVNRGPGFSFNRGFEWIGKRVTGDTVRVITLEGDNTSDLSVLPAMLAKADEGYGLVLASVYAPGGGFSRPSHYRRLVSNIANGLLRKAFGLSVFTLTSFFRVYDRAVLGRIRTAYGSYCDERGFICKVELLLRARACGARIAEVPVTLQSHLRQGPSKMKVFRTGLDYLRFLRKNAGKYKLRDGSA